MNFHSYNQRKYLKQEFDINSHLESLVDDIKNEIEKRENKKLPINIISSGKTGKDILVIKNTPNGTLTM